MKKTKLNYGLLAISFLAVILTGFIGSSAMSDQSFEWYESIKPSIAPPNYLFGIVWTILYIFIALAIFYSFSHANKKQKYALIILFGINLFANAFWTIIFFGNQEIILALLDLGVVWITTLALIIYTYKINKTSSYLLIPYLLWLTFAGLLNYLVYLRSVFI